MIVLIGFMGAGKSTVGRLLADRLELPFHDSDQVIEQRVGRRIGEIFQRDGEAAFRQVEHATVADLLGGPPAVLALGGGAAEHAGTRELLGGHQVLYLEVGYDEALRRAAHDEHRPLLHQPGLAARYQRRLTLYRQLATLVLPTGGREPAHVCREALARLGYPDPVPGPGGAPPAGKAGAAPPAGEAGAAPPAGEAGAATSA